LSQRSLYRIFSSWTSESGIRVELLNRFYFGAKKISLKNTSQRHLIITFFIIICVIIYTRTLKEVCATQIWALNILQSDKLFMKRWKLFLMILNKNYFSTKLFYNVVKMPWKKFLEFLLYDVQHINILPKYFQRNIVTHTI